MYKYSRHFLERMQERKIAKTDIELILNNWVDVLEVPSKSHPEVKLIMGFVNDKGIAVIVSTTTKVLITVRRMRKEEEKLFWKGVK